MSGIFISYRREDSTAYARLLSDTLVRQFGPELVFRDVDTMGPGVDFPSAIAEAVSECDVLLALIGEKWLTVEQDGRRRLDDEHDYVRLEIAAALERNILVVPILLEGTRMPSRAELPDALATLANRNAHRLTDEAWTYNVERLVTALRKVVAPPVEEAGEPPPAEPAEEPAVDVAPPPPAEPAEEPAVDVAPPPPAPPEPEVEVPPDPEPPDPEPPDGPGRRRTPVLVGAGVVLVLALVGLGVAVAGGGGDGGGPETVDTGEVTASTAVSEAPPAVVDPALDISPIAVVAGSTINIRGEGFQPNEKVRISYQDRELRTTVADGNGRFWEPYATPVDTSSGEYELRADGQESGASASASVRIASR